jgi:hypothetical protein
MNESLPDIRQLVRDFLAELRDALRTNIKRDEQLVRKIDDFLTTLFPKVGQLELDGSLLKPIEQEGHVVLNEVRYFTLSNFTSHKVYYDKKYRVDKAPRNERMVNLLVRIKEMKIKQNIVNYILVPLTGFGTAIRLWSFSGKLYDLLGHPLTDGHIYAITNLCAEYDKYSHLYDVFEYGVFIYEGSNVQILDVTTTIVEEYLK